jgi:hypothetical protein
MDIIDEHIEAEEELKAELPAAEQVPPQLCGSFNRNFYSSLLFAIPTIYGSLINYPAVAIGSFICLLTSVCNHYYESKHQLFNKVDIITVNSIAAYFTFQCFRKIGFTFYAILMYILGSLALIIWFYHKYNPQLYETHYCLVHIVAITGIMCYIKAYDKKRIPVSVL